MLEILVGFTTLWLTIFVCGCIYRGLSEACLDMSLSLFGKLGFIFLLILVVAIIVALSYLIGDIVLN